MHWSFLLSQCTGLLTQSEHWSHVGRSFGSAAGLLPGPRSTSAPITEISLSKPESRPHYPNMPHYQRRLPHWDIVDARLFITFRLHGSLPPCRIFPPELTGGRAFVAMDKLLDHPAAGPMFLRIPEIAAIVVKAIQDGDHRFHRYDLHAFVVMPNHAHLLVTSKTLAANWLRSLKGFTGHEASGMLSLNGAPFWQEESYDHLIRNDREFAGVQRYIENNPVKAGLARTPEEYPWSSAFQR